MEELSCAVQTYEWGKTSEESLVYILKTEDEPDSVPQNEKYSELWMGTHANGPSVLKHSRIPLEEYLSPLYESWDSELQKGSLPFLFKVLSIDKPLSIQAHPDKTLAKKLHERHPNTYKDPNHKPELICALTPLKALCGFRPIEEIFALAHQNAPELIQLLGSEFFLSIEKNSGTNPENQDSESRLKSLFSRLMHSSEEQVKAHLSQLIERVSQQNQQSEIDQLVLDIHREFPNDIGVFCVFFLNYVQLNPGEAIFLGPNLPHCYLSGNGVECMACSDNVIRAGLTPKMRDSETLLEMLSYQQTPVDILSGERIDEFTLRYPVPVKEFLLYRSEIEALSSEYSFPRPQKNSPGILLVVGGTASLVVQHSTLGEKRIDLHSGNVLFIHPDSELRFHNPQQLKMFFCTCLL